MTYEPDSPLVTRVEQSVGYRSDSYADRREYGATVTHVTGSGPLQRYQEGWRPDWAELGPGSSLLDVAVAIYCGIMRAAPHYLIWEDQVVQLCPERLAAWHVGSALARQYRRRDWVERAQYDGEAVDVSWWPDRWGGLGSPLELAGGRLWGRTGELSANSGSIGVEVLWPYDEARTPPSEQTWQTWARLVRDIHERRGIPLTPYYAVGHSDAHPAARSSGGESWDPPAELLTPDLVADRLGVPAMCPPDL
jgi:hypothetical protein